MPEPISLIAMICATVTSIATMYFNYRLRVEQIHHHSNQTRLMHQQTNILQGFVSSSVGGSSKEMDDKSHTHLKGTKKIKELTPTFGEELSHKRTKSN